MNDFQKYCIDCDKCVRDAMKQLDETAKKILFVTKNNKLLGSLSDGDLRRYLLSGGTMDMSVALAMFKNPQVASSREQAISLIENLHYASVPVVLADGTVKDVVFPNEKNEAEYPSLDIPVVIMAGGKGTRLEPYTKILPKPLIPVGDLPVIEHIMQHFAKYNCNDFHLIVNHKKQLIKAYFSENERTYNTFWYDEPKPLGTGGGLSMLKGSVDKTFFLTNCDIMIMADYDDILRFHKENHNAVTMVCAYKTVTIPYGVIETGENGEITAMKEKPEFSFQTNTGMYVVEPEVLADIEGDVPIGFPEIIELQKKKGRKVAAYPVSQNDWLDMGQLEELEKMRIRLYGE